MRPMVMRALFGLAIFQGRDLRRSRYTPAQHIAGDNDEGAVAALRNRLRWMRCGGLRESASSSLHVLKRRWLCRGGSSRAHAHGGDELHGAGNLLLPVQRRRCADGFQLRAPFSTPSSARNCEKHATMAALSPSERAPVSLIRRITKGSFLWIKSTSRLHCRISLFGYKTRRRRRQGWATCSERVERSCRCFKSSMMLTALKHRRRCRVNIGTN